MWIPWNPSSFQANLSIFVATWNDPGLSLDSTWIPWTPGSVFCAKFPFLVILPGVGLDPAWKHGGVWSTAKTSELAAANHQLRSGRADKAEQGRKEQWPDMKL